MREATTLRFMAIGSMIFSYIFAADIAKEIAQQIKKLKES